ncbi:MAG: TRAP transporter large permease [Hyphomicrobiaceae bacterium]
MTPTQWMLSAGFVALLMLRVPFAIALAASTVGGLLLSDIELTVFAQRMISGTQSFSLLAVPFFILAGDLMTAGGLSRRLVATADVLVRHRTGGLGIVTVLAATFFAAISGSAPATTAAIGVIMIPEMSKRGYDPAFATALAVAGGIIGPIIPPSIILIIWGVMAEQSIARLFLAGIVPGVLLSIGLMAVCWWHARRTGVPREEPATWNETIHAFRDGKWALLAPLIILGGIYGGIVTPTEAAVVAVVYALAVGFFAYRELTLRELPKILASSLRTTAIVMFILVAANGFGWLIALERMPDKVAALFAGLSEHHYVLLLCLNVLLLAIGCVMDNLAAMTILATILIKIGNQIGMDPIQLGAMVSINFTIGMATPPFGYALFVGAAVSKLPIGAISRPLMPMLLVMAIVLAIVTYIPAATLWVQRLM